MSRRLYLGRLPPDVRSDEVQGFFNGYGKIIDCRVMSGFGFIEFDSSRDAEEVVRNFNGKPFQNSNIIVEFAKEARSRRDPYDAPPRARRAPGIRLIVTGISRDTSWQDLKDFAREAGSVSFADIDREAQGQGILEFLTRDDAERAVKTLDGKELRGQAVRVAITEERAPQDSYRRDDRRDDRPSRYDRDDRDPRGPPPRDDRYGSRNGGGRDRSRSPGRSRPEYDRGGGRARSPPPSRYDDRRAGGADHEDRRGAPADAYERRRDDRGADRREDRRDERSSRSGGGGGGGGSSSNADPAYQSSRPSGW